MATYRLRCAPQTRHGAKRLDAAAQAPGKSRPAAPATHVGVPPSRPVARPLGMKISRLTVIAVLASLCACGQSGAGPVPTVPGTETIVLPRADQPKAHRPTLERLKREAASSGRSLEEVVKRYATRVAATSSPRPTDFEGYDPAVTDPDVAIDGIPYAELVDLGTIAKSEGISYEEAIDRFGSQSSNGRVIDKLNAEFPDEISGVRYVDDQRGLRVGFKGPIPARDRAGQDPSPGGHPDRRQGILGPAVLAGPGHGPLLAPLPP